MEKKRSEKPTLWQTRDCSLPLKEINAQILTQTEGMHIAGECAENTI